MKMSLYLGKNHKKNTKNGMEIFYRVLFLHLTDTANKTVVKVKATVNATYLLDEAEDLGNGIVFYIFWILYKGSCFMEFIKQVGKSDKM